MDRVDSRRMKVLQCLFAPLLPLLLVCAQQITRRIEKWMSMSDRRYYESMIEMGYGVWRFATWFLCQLPGNGAKI